ncbi:MAG: radical SAM protein [bacterium]
MRILLLNLIPKQDKKNYLGYNHGLGYISACLKEKGHTTFLLSIQEINNQLFNQINELCPQLIGIYLTTFQYHLCKRLLQSYLQYLNIPIILGGPHPTACPKDCIKLPSVFGVCIGEGEDAFIKLIENEKNIDNLWLNQDGEIIKNKVGKITKDLDSLPFPDRSIFPYRQVLNEWYTKIVGVEFLTSRGCPYNCNYCATQSGFLRRRSITSVIEEIKKFIKEYNYHGVIGFQDDTFTLDNNWLEQFVQAYKTTINLPFWCNSRIDTIDVEKIKLLKEAGCFRVHLGIETGNDWIRKHILGKDFTNEEIIEKCNLLKKFKIKVVVFFMIGIPYERIENIYESIRLCQMIKPHWIIYSVFYPFPGTKLYSTCLENNWLKENFYQEEECSTFYSPKLSYNHPSLSEEKIAYFYNQFIELTRISLGVK